MASLNISIPNPVLIAGQFFRVEYSTDGTSYTLWGNETNTPFTVTGLTAGVLYYFRFTLLKSLSPLVECDPVIKTYFIPETQPCESVTGEIIETEGVYHLEITFSVSSPISAPCGGWILRYGIAPNLTGIALASLSPNPMTFPASNDTYTVELYSVDCEGNETLCDEITVDPPFTPCEKAILSSVTLNDNAGVFTITFVIIPPTPAVNMFTIFYKQDNTLVSGAPDIATVQVNATGANPQTITLTLSPNMNLYSRILTYIGSITDGCGGVLLFDKSLVFA